MYCSAILSGVKTFVYTNMVNLSTWLNFFYTLIRFITDELRPLR